MYEDSNTRERADTGNSATVVCCRELSNLDLDLKMIYSLYRYLASGDVLGVFNK